MESILTSIKKLLNIVEADTSFDEDIKIHINSVFATLKQLGIGPTGGFMIEDATSTWDAFLGDDQESFNSVKSYMYMRVRLMFDPPQTQHLNAAMKEQVQEFEWRLSTERELNQWVSPNPAPIEEAVLDGGEL